MILFDVPNLCSFFGQLFQLQGQVIRCPTLRTSKVIVAPMTARAYSIGQVQDAAANVKEFQWTFQSRKSGYSKVRRGRPSP
jgi:hypothetical protein